MIPKLPANVAQLIEKEAEHHANIQCRGAYIPVKRPAFEDGYKQAAKKYALKAQKLVEALEKIANSKSPANDGELDQWEMTARNEANEALKQYNSNI